MDGSRALGVALGHLRNATAGFLAEEDPSGEWLFLAAECLEVEGLFADLGVVPVVVEPGPDAVKSLRSAAAVLGDAVGEVPLAVWAAVQALRARAER